jgi:hypothetical protein
MTAGRRAAFCRARAFLASSRAAKQYRRLEAIYKDKRTQNVTPEKEALHARFVKTQEHVITITLSREEMVRAGEGMTSESCRRKEH